MNSLLIPVIILLVAFGIVLFAYLAKNRRVNELKVKTIFASGVDELVKVEMDGEDSVAEIAGNFNVIGEKLAAYRKNSAELSGIQSEKKILAEKIRSFQDSASQLSLLTDIGKKITSGLNLHEIALKYYNYISSSMMAKEINLLIITGEVKKYFNVINGKMEEINDETWMANRDNILNWCFENNREAFLNDAQKDYGQYIFTAPAFKSGEDVESLIAIPLGTGKKMIGAVSIMGGAKNVFTDFHLEFARAISSYVTVAIDNANLYGELDNEKQKSEKLLLNILPAEVANELKQTGRSEAMQYENVSVVFTDFVNFTGISGHLGPKELVAAIHEYYKGFDEISEKYNQKHYLS